MAKGDPLSVAIPIPRGLMELAGDFKHAIADAKRELDAVTAKMAERREAGLKRDPELTERRAELRDQIKALQEKQTAKDEQAKLLQNLEASIHKGIGTAQQLARVATAQFGPADIRAASQALVARGTELVEKGSIRVGALLGRIGVAGGVGAAIGTAVAYGLEAYADHTRALTRIQERTNRFEDQMYSRMWYQDLYGSRFSSEDQKEFIKGINRAEVVQGVADKTFKYGELGSALWTALGGTSERQAERTIAAKEHQARIEEFVRRHGEHWRVRLNPMTIGSSEAARRRMIREYFQEGYTGVAKGLLYRAVADLTVGHIDPREKRLNEIGREWSQKYMDDYERRMALEGKRIMEHPEYRLAELERNVYLRAMESYRHDRYLQWSPY